ncbi:bifunctional preprotein translocase subunit SecD/SecF [Kordia sp. SMS9]|uniref:protein translocase subunit SecDF n=1 Tax=Kordia sp. SMS9 TaxID=2282170 RepID=UPI000E0CC6B2|nr:protein translocase subunit SecDF [Kordia sp. SMS9]AXG72308.1 bifunctional preprotein translocase subunit SecD/SecF [Kordia sp. SMS9]
MQNKGLVKLFAILFGLVSIYQLSFTFITNKIENDAKAYAITQMPKPTDGVETKENTDARALIEKTYLDSIDRKEPISFGFTKFTYSEAKEKELNKGLDLKGGINVILQISVRDILKGLTNDTDNETFKKALDRADELQKDAQEDYLESFFRAFDELKPAGLKLADPSLFYTASLQEELKENTFNTEDAVVQNVLRRKVDQSIVSAKEVLNKRIDQFGVTQPNIQRLGTSGRILIELPGAKDVIRIEKLLQTTAELEFWKTNNNTAALTTYLVSANEKLKELPEFAVEKETTEENDDQTDLLTSTEEDSLKVVNPLFDKISLAQNLGGGVIAIAKEENRAEVLKLLSNPILKQILPADLRTVSFAFGKTVSPQGTIELYALNGKRKGKEATPQMKGDVVDGAQQSYGSNGKPNVTMQMNGIGAKQWEKLTGEVFEERGFIAVVLDNIVYSAPSVTSGAISGGNTEISGNFSIEEAQDLANVLRAGKLPAQAEILQSEIVGPSLGQEAIDSGLMSFLIALGLVLVWMVFYYGRAGLFADVALAFNILLIFGVLANLGAVLTLPGIAGIVLTIGMSVDANVLLFERVREELAKGKSLQESINHAFSWKGAMSSIFDANITTGLTALILFLFGTGPIKGFATTLLIGIATSLFTAIFITRLLIDWYVAKGKDLAFSTGATKNLFRNMKINFLNKRKIAYIISGIIIAIGLYSITLGSGLNQGVDFVGGRSYQVRFENTISPQDVKTSLQNVFVDGENAVSLEVKTFGDDNQLKITTNYKVDETGTEVDDDIKKKLHSGLGKYLPKDMTYDRFVDGAEDKAVGIMQSIKVGPTIADDIKKASFWAVLGSLVVVFLYILLRFRRWQFSLGAVAAVFHDVLIVLGIFSLAWKYLPFTMEINQAFIAAILTVIGYSLNDTVVVFDRIREFMNEQGSWKLSKVVNAALNSTLSRTLNTSLTTLVVLLAIFIFGGESIRGFMFALIIGVIVGTYSSMFIATPIMYDTIKKGDINKGLEEETKA